MVRRGGSAGALGLERDGSFWLDCRIDVGDLDDDGTDETMPFVWVGTWRANRDGKDYPTDEVTALLHPGITLAEPDGNGVPLWRKGDEVWLVGPCLTLRFVRSRP